MTDNDTSKSIGAFLHCLAGEVRLGKSLSIESTNRIAAESAANAAAAEVLKRDAVRAWNDYQVSGLHLTHEEADAWLAKLEAGEDAEPPKLHK